MTPAVGINLDYNFEGEIFKLNHIELMSFLNIKMNKDIGLDELIKIIKKDSLIHEYDFNINDTIIIEETYDKITIENI